MPAIRELHYRIAGTATGLFPGAHRSRSGDGGFEFRGHAPLHDAPDARRLDLHASLRDPFGGWIVRLSSERRAIPVAVVADLSASMGFDGAVRKLDVLADFTASLAWSASRIGDSFGFVGCDERVRRELLLPQTRRRGAGLELANTLRAWTPRGRSAHALHDAHRHLPVQRALAQVQEPESGERRWLWWRPALRERWLAEHAARRAALMQVFRAQRLAPLFIEGAFDADAVTRHFLA